MRGENANFCRIDLKAILKTTYYLDSKIADDSEAVQYIKYKKGGSGRTTQKKREEERSMSSSPPHRIQH